MVVGFAFAGTNPTQSDERDYDNSRADGEFCFGVQRDAPAYALSISDSIILARAGDVTRVTEAALPRRPWEEGSAPAGTGYDFY